jgi:hypothetical protein
MRGNTKAPVMMPDLMKKEREAAPKRLYDARSHEKTKRSGTKAPV